MESESGVTEKADYVYYRFLIRELAICSKMPCSRCSEKDVDFLPFSDRYLDVVTRILYIQKAQTKMFPNARTMP